jgi:glutamate synthase domain-containing protein 2/glutamate synthase domain-containing protein 1/glutamate synthase domain-containing protein 3
MISNRGGFSDERSACGVGFIVNRSGHRSHEALREALEALERVEHRGACGADGLTGDGSGIMTDIPFDLLGYERGKVAVATLFMPSDRARSRRALQVFEETFLFMGLRILEYREVPCDESVLGADARGRLPSIKQAIIERPVHCRTDEAFNKLLYLAKQHTRTRQRSSGIIQEFFFTSLSTTTIVYKALTNARDLPRFYRDLRNPAFTTRFALFHRRFSTNTRTSWDKAQPFRLIAHNGEINTIAGNRAWALSREQALGLPPDELLTHEGISDSGSLNEMVEALKYRSSIPHVEDLLAILMPPADLHNSYYQFWARALEPWDGPAFIAYSDGETIGARLDRNGFRPCRWAVTNDAIYLASEAGAFTIDEGAILQKGVLRAGRGFRVSLSDGSFSLEDPSQSQEVKTAAFDPRLISLPPAATPPPIPETAYKAFGYNQEIVEKILVPMILEGKEPIGSMGDTARLAILSDEDRPLFDFFSHDFAQVTNPPLDYLRERLVTDLSTFLGPRPNIFAPKELIPPPQAILLNSPVISRAMLRAIRENTETTSCISLLFSLDHGQVGLRTALNKIASEAVSAVRRGIGILVLSDIDADPKHAPIPSLLGLRAVVNALNTQGLNLSASIVVESGEVIETHHVAMLIGFGAAAVCPALALSFAQSPSDGALKDSNPIENERRLLKAYDNGLLKIMSKAGISVARSYQGSELFTPIGISQELLDDFFPRLRSRIGGLTLPMIAERILLRAQRVAENSTRSFFPTTYQYKEHTKGTSGERHSMTNLRARLLQKMVRSTPDESASLYAEYLADQSKDTPVSIRHLLRPRQATPIATDEVESIRAITSRFGSGAMSFGAISAEAQRDIFHAMKEIGGRSNSGEGGENPFYFIDGSTSTVKQIASGRFGVTAEYLVSANEFQIKIAQGAKPGEGGQLMGVKVGRDIARARHSDEQVDLISPPPQHDIYSIEDLKQLIHDLKSFRPEAAVSVKLVAGSGIGTIAVGVAKAGAEIIHIAGWDGGTGASPLSSMKHAGLPWELGLVEVHATLVDNNLRDFVRVRVDGGLQTGADVVTASLLGADEFDFGKVLLVAEGCVMARVCEKNKCPAGIATHDPKFKAKYTGTVDGIVRLLDLIAADVRVHLAALGLRGLDEACGRSDLLEVDPLGEVLCHQRHLDLGEFLRARPAGGHRCCSLNIHQPSPLNSQIVADCARAIESGEPFSRSYSITTGDRSIGAPLSAAIAQRVHDARLKEIAARGGVADTYGKQLIAPPSIDLHCSGSAGQGFGVFLTEGVTLTLEGEANDSVGKGMSGGAIIIRPPAKSRFRPEQNVIIGNCALYGATGGVLFALGTAGDRFAVRNSGATAVLEGAGLHLCEYMTRGLVVVLGEVSHNVGAGMTGGTLYLLDEYQDRLNPESVCSSPIRSVDEQILLETLNQYSHATKSQRVQWLLSEWRVFRNRFLRVVPIRTANQEREAVTREEGVSKQAVSDQAVGAAV